MRPPHVFRNPDAPVEATPQLAGVCARARVGGMGALDSCARHTQSFHTLSTFMGTGGGLGKDYETFLSEQVSALAMATEEECAALASEVTHERRLIKMMTTTDDDDEPFGKGVLIVKTGTLRVTLPRPGSTQDHGVVGSEKTTVNFTSGDVVAEADLRALVDSASAMGHGASSTLAEDEGTSLGMDVPLDE